MAEQAYRRELQKREAENAHKRAEMERKLQLVLRLPLPVCAEDMQWFALLCFSAFGKM